MNRVSRVSVRIGPAMTIDSSFLILHGIDNERPVDHWQHILAGELRERGNQVLYPQLPEPSAPSFERWRDALFAELGELLGGERVVVCHSMACCLWLRSAPAIAAERPVDRLLLVSPPDSDLLPENGADFRCEWVDGDAVRASCRSAARVVCGERDPYRRAGPPQWAGAAGAEIDVLPGVGHVTPDDGHGPWSSCLAWCLDPAVRIEP